MTTMTPAEFWSGALSRFAHYVQQAEKLLMQTLDLTPVNLVTFTVTHQLDLLAPPKTVFEALTTDIGNWWGAPYVRDGAQDMVLDAVPGGHMLQTFEGGGAVVMATVQELRPARLIAMVGTLGIPGAVYGRFRYSLEPGAGGTTALAFEHHVIGELQPGVQNIFHEGWALLLDNYLRAYLEEGRAVGLRADA